ncbi:MAG TPA: hypothetical protein VMU08_03370 [Rhizomicrobium sp.]|nr:hypothetical protein [Rhizomicrobium sp.]
MAALTARAGRPRWSAEPFCVAADDPRAKPEWNLYPVRCYGYAGMTGQPSMNASKNDVDISLAEFLELIERPYSQPTIARLIDRLFGYSLSGSYSDTQVLSATGQIIALRDLYDLFQQDSALRASLRRAAHSLHQ